MLSHLFNHAMLFTLSAISVAPFTTQAVPIPNLVSGLLGGSSGASSRGLFGSLLGRGNGYGQSQYDQPGWGGGYINPAFVHPAYFQSAYQHPAYLHPAYQHSAYLHPAYIHPAYLQPAAYGGGYFYPTVGGGYVHPAYGGHSVQYPSSYGGFSSGYPTHNEYAPPIPTSAQTAYDQRSGPPPDDTSSRTGYGERSSPSESEDDQRPGSQSQYERDMYEEGNPELDQRPASQS